MVNLNQLNIDLQTLGISKETSLDVKLITTQYKKLAKTIHPDKRGSTEDFQELQNAFKRRLLLLKNKMKILKETVTSKRNFL